MARGSTRQGARDLAKLHHRHGHELARVGLRPHVNRYGYERRL